jgi:hypothetical protein
MGYRSEVGFRAAFRSNEDRDALWNRLTDREKELCLEAGLEIVPVGFQAHFPDTKWYEEYPDVKAIERLIRVCEEAAEGYDEEDPIPNTGFFGRVGEDSDDTVERYWRTYDDPELPLPWELGQVVRTIQMEIR